MQRCAAVGSYVVAALMGGGIAAAQDAAPSVPAPAQAQTPAEAQPAEPPAVPAPGAQGINDFVMTPELAARLAALRPEDPERYFLLAEEIADGAMDLEPIQLARTLYTLAFHLDQRPGRSGALAASAAVGLAQIERLERDRRWLLALAGAIDRRYAATDWTVSASASISEETAYQAATALGLARSGDGRDARRLLEERGVRDLLRRYERAIGTTGETGALFRIERYAEQWPCRECGNARVVTKPTERGPELRLCSTCRGNPGPRLSDEELIGQLRFESYLLNGIQRSWGAQSIVDHGAPLRDPDPGELAESMGVDVSKPYWRNEAWVERP